MDNKSTQSGHEIYQNDAGVHKVSFKCTVSGHGGVKDRSAVHKMDK